MDPSMNEEPIPLKARPIISSSWGLSVSKEFNVPIEIYVDYSFREFNYNSNAIKILLVNEPPEILPYTIEHALQQYDRYHFVLTYNKMLLDKLPNARFFIACNSWIKDDYVFPEKNFSVSTVVGFKSDTTGHLMRHALWNFRHRITAPKRFFTSSLGGPVPGDADFVLGDSKYPLFDSQFHVAIENIKMPSLWSEKILDCFRTKTVPIYWGTPDIEDYFDIRGILMVRSVEDIIKTCNNLNQHTYENMLEYVENNYVISAKYLNIDTRLGDTLASILSELNP